MCKCMHATLVCVTTHVKGKSQLEHSLRSLMADGFLAALTAVRNRA